MTIRNTDLRAVYTVDQQVVIKCNSHGTWFAQFPARIYVDGKFTPARKFDGAVA